MADETRLRIASANDYDALGEVMFEAMGFVIDHHETVEIDGQHLAHARMTKTL